MNLDKEASADPVDEALDLLDDMDSDDLETDEDDAIADDDLRSKTNDQDDDEEAGDDDSDEDDDAPAEAEQDKGGKPKSRAQKRIDKLTREKNDARREAEYERREREALRHQFDSLSAQVQHLQPTREQLEAGQQRGMSQQDVQQLVRQQASEMVEAERFNQIGVDLTKRLRDGGAEEAMQRLTNPALVNLAPEAVIALHEAKFSTDVVNTIAGNEELFERFTKLRSPVDQARFIDRLDGRLEARKDVKKAASTVKATPRVRGSARKPEKDPDDMNQAEFEAYARKQGWLE